MKKILLLLMSLTVSGCASFGEGVTTAFLNKQKEEDLRECRIDGKSFAGMQGDFDRSNNLLKVLTHLRHLYCHFPIISMS